MPPVLRVLQDNVLYLKHNLNAKAVGAISGEFSVLQQDVEDLKALEVTKTPTFFVNGRGLPSFGADQLAALVAQEVTKTKK